ncbi:BrxA family protein [Erythrobacter donghaensis]|uniref:BrxA family protein n=1 Tax=Erythrobacter donghaensis TaxID=267135 RepID=UPI000A7FCFB6|nr:BrxA family protein [Erythrobacter donghaensis]
MTQKANTSKYRMSFGTGGLFLNESVAIARLYQELGDWTAVKKAAGAKGVIPFRKQSSVTRSVREIANRLEVLRA